jgi:hypothetical protein
MLFEPKSWGENLLTTENTKTIKGEPLGYLTGILYLAPSKESGFNTCPKASVGCAKACLFTAGHAGIHPHINRARIQKTLNFFNNRAVFLNDLRESIAKIVRIAKKRGVKPAIRLNGTSDIEWSRFGIFKEFPDVQFYDYTKVVKYILNNKDANHHFTFSRSESNDKDVAEVLAKSPLTNVAVVFSTKRSGELPKEYLGKEIINADEHDLRFLDKPGTICGLRAKGKARKSDDGFVVTV